MAYFPPGDPRNSDPNANPNDPRVWVGDHYEMPNGSGVPNSISQGTGAHASDASSFLAVPDELFTGLTGSKTSPTDWVTDMYSAQDASAGKTDARDFQYGGDAQVRDQTIQGLAARGTGNYGVLSDVANQDYRALQGAAGSIYSTGAEAAHNAAANAVAAASLSDEARLAGQTLNPYGDQYSLGNWQRQAGAMGAFQPSNTSVAAGKSLAAYQPTSAADASNRLLGFDAGPVSNQTLDTYGALRNYAEQGPGPSAAEAQLTKAQDTNVAAQVALARSGRGAGANAQGARQAQFQAADIGQKTAADMATLRANEAATWRGQQMQALGQAGGLATNYEQARQGVEGMGLSALQSAGQLYSTQDQQRLAALEASGQFAANQDQQRLAAQQAAASAYGQQYGAVSGNQAATTQAQQGYLSQALAGQQAWAGQQAGSYDQYLGALTSGAGVQNTAGQNRIAGIEAGLGQQAAYDQAAIGVRENEAARRTQLANTTIGAQTQASLGNQQADLEKDKSSAGFIGGLFMPSDKRVKTSIKRYCALGGK
jgi:hypothetical protein